MAVINRETGQLITPAEQRLVDRRARQILSSPYSAPELVEWAIECASPNIVELWFWESNQQAAIRRRREQEHTNDAE